MIYPLVEFGKTLELVRGMDGGEFAPPTSGALYSLERICECGIQNFAAKIARVFKNDDERDGFFILLFVEALFQSAIHCYDPGNYSKYMELVRTPIHISWHGWTGSKPQALLTAVTRWDASREEYLLNTIRQLVPLAAQIYDKRIEWGGGQRLIRLLSEDRDMVHGYPSEEAITESLKRAQQELRGIRSLLV